MAMQVKECDKRIVSGALEMLLEAEAVFFDLDGCVYFGERLADGAQELLDYLRLKGKKIQFVTNNSTDTGAQVAARLTRMGLETQPEHVATATELIGAHLLKRFGPVALKVVGSRSLHQSLEQAGHRLVPLHSGTPVRTLVIGRDTEYDYGKMQAIVEEMDQGTPVLATNPDVFHPGSRGEKVPETGSLYSPLEAITGKKVSYFGKPAPYMFELTMERCGVTRPEACVMVGDNLLTDIAGGRSAGLKTLWLYGMSGASEEAADPKAERPDFAVPDLLTLALASGSQPQ